MRPHRGDEVLSWSVLEPAWTLLVRSQSHGSTCRATGKRQEVWRVSVLNRAGPLDAHGRIENFVQATHKRRATSICNRPTAKGGAKLRTTDGAPSTWSICGVVRVKVAAWREWRGAKPLPVLPALVPAPRLAIVRLRTPTACERPPRQRPSGRGRVPSQKSNPLLVSLPQYAVAVL